MQQLLEENRNLSHEVDEKTRAVGNLMNVIQNKSQELNRLMEEIENKEKENEDLCKHLHDIQNSFDNGVMELLNEKEQALSSLQLARQESRELLIKMKNYDEIIHKKDEMSESFAEQAQDYNNLKNILERTIDENKKLQMDISNRENNNSILLQEIQRLREVHKYAVGNINNLEDENNQYKLSLDLTRKESEILENKLVQFDELREKLHGLTESQQKLLSEKSRLEREVHDKAIELENAKHSIQLAKKESEDLTQILQQDKNLKVDFSKLNDEFNKLLSANRCLQEEMDDKNRDFDNLLQNLHRLQNENDRLSLNSNKLKQELDHLQKLYDDLSDEKADLQKDFDNKTEEIDMLHGTLENKIKENQKILKQIKSLEKNQMEARDSISSLQNENLTSQLALESTRKESSLLMNKLKCYEAQAVELDKLKQAYDQIKHEKEMLQGDLSILRADMKRVEKENRELDIQSQNLITHNEDLENALINARKEVRTLMVCCQGVVILFSVSFLIIGICQANNKINIYPIIIFIGKM